ncbi:MAG: TetR/AcrR family transcriptional regulator, partial [Anaerolineaceae bacterium]|nr:TetR/AcrR family transcriptional regulator [Anaerolineaceae bacterium]
YILTEYILIMPNKRQINKLKTREKLFQTAKDVFLEKGFLDASTAEIAQRADVAHGTLFLHFESKENLIMSIFDEMLIQLTDELNDVLNDLSDMREMLEIYLDWLERNEVFYVIIARELPYYTDSLRRIILGREGAARHYFIKAIRRGIQSGIYKEVDETSAVNFLFAAIHFYLRLKPAYAEGESVIQTKKDEIIHTFLTFITRYANAGK